MMIVVGVGMDQFASSFPSAVPLATTLAWCAVRGRMESCRNSERQKRCAVRPCLNHFPRAPFPGGEADEYSQ